MLPDASARAEGRAPLPFLIFLAMMTSVVALTIDAILPALDSISADLGFADATDRQLLVLAVFAGMGLGQPVFGPLSDAIGRRPAAIIGWALYAVGTVVAMQAGDLWWIVAGRVLQGIGAAGPRVVATAIVRDLYGGRAMARIVSLIMTVFMLVPMFAPLIGQGLEALAGWRAIFGLYLAMAFVCAGWHLSLPETLPLAARRPLQLVPGGARFRRGADDAQHHALHRRRRHDLRRLRRLPGLGPAGLRGDLRARGPVSGGLRADGAGLRACPVHQQPAGDDARHALAVPDRRRDGGDGRPGGDRG